ncbi:deoxyguanosinetriphosphate triphosphohydrolase [Hymenobacter sedentarius]|uniref:Deoxyguanosinetriphosphate triphosphohydrolase n=1 Tax=Hymenobacter sedentarius TaxID=1411621 RepID=A0A0U4CR58_9BACT|nr:dNTP triphosphohydrolase [Hymenobacter sedentarius]ALW85870.1 deoxyguanosinetriphosphate triphosphohydrolase [Hymenobacter sedentarius]
MPEPMHWPRLLSQRRFPDQQLPPPSAAPVRGAFVQDYDRVVFSSAFRRLQRKTQVMPLPETDFVHTRLTHSLETAVVGRSLGRLAARHLLENDAALAQLLPNLDQDCGDIVAAACLAHDIGNPPFGHSGEDAISSYFASHAAAPYLDKLTPAEVADLQHFEGNAAGFRILTHTYAAHSTGTAGLGLTYATLGAFTKYPKPSLVPAEAKSGGASEKKYGHFQTENPRFRHVAAELGLIPKGDRALGFTHRHPLAFLVEAADDLCYRIIDFEDGLKLGLIDPQAGLGLLKKMLNDPAGRVGSVQWHDWREELGYVRARLIGKLVAESAALFAQHAPAILCGEYDQPLIKELGCWADLQEVQRLSIEKLYRSRPVLEIEAAGFEVLGGLLDAFLCAVFDEGQGHRSRKLLLLLPEQFRAEGHQAGVSAYEKILLLTDFVAGMTDQNALSLYKTIKGIELPKGF